MSAHRYYVFSPNDQMILGLDSTQAAEATALEYGNGARIVDTLAKAYQPMVQEVLEGELVISGVSGWDTGKPGRLDLDLIEAVKKGRVEIVRAFLEKGASANARDGRGGTALHWAAGGGKVDIVTTLLKAGADPAATDHNGMTPLQVAQRRRHEQIAGLLQEAMRARD